MTAGVPPRLGAGTKAALLDLVDGAVTSVSAGAEHACAIDTEGPSGP